MSRPTDDRAGPEHGEFADLLATKLDVPRVRSDYLHRARLVERFEAASASVVLVSTPAGFGKSSLVADWASRTGRQLAWVSLEQDDGDPARFWRYVAAAVSRVSRRAAECVLPLLRRPAGTTGETVVTALVEGLRDEPRHVTLVLDDYQVIDSTRIHEDVALLLARRPPRLSVVLSTRSDPPLPLPRLRAQGELVELRAQDLRFTGEEVSDLLLKSWDFDLSAESVATLADRTEGWAVGLQLAAVALRGATDTEAAVRALAGTHRFVLDYLSDEVLDRQPEPVREFLLRCSILDRLSGPLCDAVTEGSDGQRMLEELERANLFLVPLDDERHWFRFHHLFADLLRDRLTRTLPDSVPQLHRRAGEWCERHDLPDSAIRHALGACDELWAVRLVERYVDELLLRSEGTTMLRWIGALPPELVNRRPRLLVAQARFNIYESRVQGTDQLLDAAEPELDKVDSEPYRPSRGSAASPLANVGATHALLRAFVAHLRGNADDTIKHAAGALTKIRPDEWALHGIAEANLGTAEWLAGHLSRAEEKMAANLETWLVADEPGRAAWSSHYLGRIQRDQGRLSAAEVTYRSLLEIGTAPDYLPEAPVGVAHVGLAAVAYERDDLDSAREHAIVGIDVCRRFVHNLPSAAGLGTLAMIRQADGEAAAAMDAIEEAVRLTDPAVADLLNPVWAVRARLLLENGDLSSAVQWAESRGLGPDDEPVLSVEPAHLALARILLAQHRPGDALALLDRLRAAAVEQGRMGSRIEIDALRALGAQAAGDQTRATATLSETLELAEPEGYIRVFVNEGPAMAGLLRRVARIRERGRAGGPSTAARDHANRVLQAFRRTPSATGPGPAPHPTGALTARELEVLVLIAHGKRNQQIAAELFVTLDTVKKHVSHIYTKLGVAGRTEALARARELELLP